MLVLTVEIHQPFPKVSDNRDSCKGTVDGHTTPAFPANLPADNKFPVRYVDSVRCGQITCTEGGLDQRIFGPGTYHGCVCPVSENCLKSIHDHRFPSAGLTREYRQTWIEGQREILDDGEIPDGKVV